MGWVRDEAGVDAQFDGTTITLRQPYLLVDVSADAAHVAMHPGNYLGGNSGNEPLPAINSSHPTDPRLLLDAYAVASDGSTKRIIALYSSNRAFRWPDPNTVPPEGYRWSVSFQTQTVQIPWTTRVRQEVAAGVFRDAWLYLEQAMFERIMTVSITARIKRELIGNAIEIIGGQANKIHRIGGVYYLFEPGEITDAGDGGDYQASFVWSRPYGITIDYNEPLPTVTYFPRVQSKLPNTSEYFAKPPLHEVVLRPPADGDPSTIPDFIAVLRYDYDPNGYASILALIA